jgi:uroporphyrinogen decarboxylase
VVREFKNNPLSSMPQFVRFPVQTRDEFRKFWRERMQPDLAARIGPDWRAQMRKFKDRDYLFVVLADRWGGFFGGPRNLVGVETLCMMFRDDPAFVEEMMDATADFLIAMLGQMLEETSIDVLGFWGTWATVGAADFSRHGEEVHGAALPARSRFPPARTACSGSAWTATARWIH